MKLPHGLCNEIFDKLPLDEKRALVCIISELQEARKKHPKWPKDLIHQAAIVSEEAGETVKAALQNGYETGRYYDVMREAIHVAATAVRMVHSMSVKKAALKQGWAKKQLI